MPKKKATAGNLTKKRGRDVRALYAKSQKSKSKKK